MKNKVKNFISQNRILDKVLSCLYPVIIAAYSFCRVDKGLEITDTAYNYSNFKFSSNLDDMWFFSTFLSNIIGRFFTLLPGGNTMLGLNIYTGSVKCLILLVAFFFLTKRVKLSKHVTFIGVMIAAGLSWCPTAVLYNYLTYLFLLLGVIFIYEAEVSPSVSKENRFFIIAGICLGANVFVRLPNLCEAALIVVVWYVSIVRKETFKVSMRKTLMCILGYVLSFALCIMLAFATRGYEAYFRGITQMFSGGGDATSQYSPKGLLFTAYSGYIGISYWAILMIVAAVFVGALSLVSVKLIEPKIKSEKVLKFFSSLKYIATFVVFLFTVFWFRRTGLYTDNYFEYSSMYGINIVVLVISIISLLVIALIPNEKSPFSFEYKILAASALVVIFITPLGSNNGMYSVLNNQYLILPLMLGILVSVLKTKKWVNPICIFALLITLTGGLHSVLFGLNFTFRDGGGKPINCRVDNNKILKGMKTIESNANYLTDISEIWEKDYKGSTILVFGNAAGLSFYLDAKPAISTVWPSLASFSYEKFENEMRLLKALHFEKGVELPVIVLGNDGMDAYLEYVAGDTSKTEAILGKTYIKKLEILYDFLKYYDYSGIYHCDTFWVFAPGEVG